MTAAAAPTRARVHGWTTLHNITCPSGHHIRQDAVVLDHGAIRCRHRSADASRADAGRGDRPDRECGAWLYVLGSVGWYITLDDNGRESVRLGDDVYVAEVTYEELRRLRLLRLNVPGALKFLGISGMPAAPLPAARR